MKIFVAEYIVVYETFNLSVYEEISVGVFAFDYVNFYSSLSKLDEHFMF